MLFVKEERRSPSYSYATATFILSKPDNTSSLVIAKEVKPLTLTAYFNATKSSQPTLRALPVVAPISWPFLAINSPISLCSSVGKGPSPTLVV